MRRCVGARVGGWMESGGVCARRGGVGVGSEGLLAAYLSIVAIF